MPDGKILKLDGKERSIQLLDPKTKQAILRFEDRRYEDFTCSADGKVLAACGSAADQNDRVIHLWDIGTGKELPSLKIRDDFEFIFRFSPDGKLLATNHWDGTVRLWEIASGKQQLVLERMGFNESIGHLTFSKDGKHVAVAGRDKGANFHLEADCRRALRKSSVARDVNYVSVGELITSPERYHLRCVL